MADRQVPLAADAVFSQAELTRGIWSRFFKTATVTEGSRAARVAAAFEELGGIYAAFARFLCWRADLVPADYILALRDVRATVPPVSREAFGLILLADAGTAGKAMAHALEREPCWSTLQRCAYRSTFRDERVVVQVAREPVSDKTFQAFARAVRNLEDPHIRRAARREVLAQFREWLTTGQSLERERAFLTSIEESGASAVEYPRVIAEACGRRVLTWKWVDAEPLPELIASESATAALGKVAECVMEQLCILAVTDTELDLDALAYTPEGKLVVRRAGRLVPVPRAAVPGVLKYVAAVLKTDGPAAAHQLIHLAHSKPKPDLEASLAGRLSNLEPELKVNRRFPASVAVFESNWRGLAGIGVERPLFLDSMHRNLVAIGYWSSDIAPAAGPLEDVIAEAQWVTVAGILRRRTSSMMDTKVISEWTMGAGIMLAEGIRQVNRIGKGLRDNDLGVRVAVDSSHEDQTKSNLAVRQGILMGALLMVFLAAMHFSTRVPAPFSTYLSAAAFVAAGGVLWILLRLG